MTGGFSLQRAGNVEILFSYLSCLREEAAEQSAELSVIRDAIAPMAWLSLQIDTTNMCGAPNEQYSHGWDSLIGVLFWCKLHFVFALLTCPALAISSKCNLLSYFTRH